MKNKQNMRVNFLWLGLLMIGNMPRYGFGQKSVEQFKTYTFTHKANLNDAVKVNNTFGNVRVVLWDKNWVQAQAVVTAIAPDVNLVQHFLKNVEIVSFRQNEQIVFQTQIGGENSLNKNRSNATNLSVDYLITMPEGIAIQIDNSFGEVFLPNFTAPITLNLNYCTLMADGISNKASKLNLNFGSASIKSMTGGDFNSNFANINMGDAKNIHLKNSHGNLKVKTLSGVEGVLNYSNGFLENLKEAINLQINFTNDITFGQINEHIKNFTIKANYADLILPFSEKYQGAFDIKMAHGKLSVAQNRHVRFSKNTEQGDIKPKNNHHYQGTIGDNSTHSNKVIQVVSNFGNVRIR
jgi:hypothetical protein